ncbi:uncharacterized protein BP01DRAFT_17559 [Aspergillus saccharolyticus JOP 1030-1]|uniref:Uncharacterized protein n=1 Tax=Aspergillus saccharolyticus JOP 1030-1 TaxID=1450539 RepID=A0A319AIT4_9EURO|nr:hypothetical protein BP01DRAFT_17559 [Aspergillus saccharolyticus JOP 1030-1]PYH46582.1 hypothetical protein BP01DRAFT_17559 [Aspergillus saccharolyticus JOP 1030-1]
MAQDDSNRSVFKELPDQAKATVERIKKIIGEDTTKKEGKASSGWGFSSEDLSQEIQRLSAELSINGFKVSLTFGEQISGYLLTNLASVAGIQLQSSPPCTRRNYPEWNRPSNHNPVERKSELSTRQTSLTMPLHHSKRNYLGRQYRSYNNVAENSLRLVERIMF